MRRTQPDREPAPQRRRAFETTRWSLVLAAAGRVTPEADRALAALCATYWYPLYAFVRRRGHDPERAADLTQGFFVRLLEKNDFQSLDPARGRFRAFLLAACKHFLANERDWATAQKRGGGCFPVPIDRRDAEGRYLAEPAHNLTPERLFDRRWAILLLDQSLDQLGREYEQAGKGARFERLKCVLTGCEPAGTYAETGEALGMTEAAVKKAAQRLRDRYREILRERIAETVDDPGQVDDEIRALFGVLAS